MIKYVILHMLMYTTCNKNNLTLTHVLRTLHIGCSLLEGI